MRYPWILFLSMFFHVQVWAQVSERVNYKTVDGEELYFDYYPANTGNSQKSIVFVHGGGFSGGSPEGQAPFAEEMQKRGYSVFVISYRLYAKGHGFGCDFPTPEKLKAIRYAAEDAVSATRFIVEHAEDYGVDSEQIYLAGSSAGAEAILQVLFNPFKSSMPEAFYIAEGFTFKGAMSFAGAVLDLRLVNRENWIPLLLYHGSNDQLVPYETAPHHFCPGTSPGYMMLFGSMSIYEKAKSLGLSVELHAYRDGGHEISNAMFRAFDVMDNFIKNTPAPESDEVWYYLHDRSDWDKLGK
ncbi:alpha/beta hydrolase [Echinicola shivajiensis]|uniref:alpha/beta hydrolase n=1 Tax=Echinicola shivajiensis TaxID=1035916 RepID=UPI001BFC10E7|nr:alpha/beta hydrolase fold domain-containing protein [Echinicola shivajiensis]